MTKTNTFKEHLQRATLETCVRTWIHDNLCCLTIKNDTGQHSHFFQSDSQSMSHWQWQGHLRAKFHIVISNFQWHCQSNNMVEQKICPDTFLLQLIFLLANHKGRRSIRFSHQKSERCPKESKRSALRNENRKECQVYQNYNLRLHSAGGCRLE